MFKLRNPGFVGILSGAASLTPTSLSGLVRWYKADSFSLPDGTAIGGVGNEWLDQSGSGADLTQTSGPSKPLFKTNIFGSMPAIRFSGGQQMDMTLFNSANYTILAVGMANADGMLFGNSGANMQVRVKRSGTNDISNYFGGADVFSSVFSTAAASVKLMTWLRGGGTGFSDTCRWRENKTARGNNDDFGVNAQLNRVGSTSFGGNYDGDIGEICVYNTPQTVADLDLLYDTYFKPRWGLP